jgi:hypothetical protein
LGLCQRWTSLLLVSKNRGSTESLL